MNDAGGVRLQFCFVGMNMDITKLADECVRFRLVFERLEQSRMITKSHCQRVIDTGGSVLLPGGGDDNRDDNRSGHITTNVVNDTTVDVDRNESTKVRCD